MSGAMHSIWLLPGPDDAATLAGMVDELAARFGTPRFQPHLTLAGDLPMTAEALAPLAGQMASDIAAFAAVVAAVTTSDLYFRSFYAGFAAAGPLAMLRRRAIDRIETPLREEAPNPESFVPHVSLLYGAAEERAKEAARREMAARLVGRPVLFDRVAVVRSANDIPIAAWAVRSSHALGRDRDVGA